MTTSGLGRRGERVGLGLPGCEGDFGAGVKPGEWPARQSLRVRDSGWEGDCATFRRGGERRDWEQRGKGWAKRCAKRRKPRPARRS